MNEALDKLLRRAADLDRAGRRAVGCLLVGARGSTPQSAGALMLIDENAGTWGTIGGGCVEAEVRQRAFALLSNGGTGVMRFKLDHDYGWDDGLICGGTIDLAVAPFPAGERLEVVLADMAARRATALAFDVATDDGPARYTLRIPPRDRLYIAGAGHVGQAVARLALALEYDVMMFDDRQDLLDRAAPVGVEAVAGSIADRLAEAPVDGGTDCVVVTRGHRHDEQALGAVVERGARYVGMIGSRRKVKLIFDDLRERGVDSAALERVHAPIGVDIGAVTVEEIAVSIAAELIACRRRAGGPVVEGPVALGAGSGTA